MRKLRRKWWALAVAVALVAIALAIAYVNRPRYYAGPIDAVVAVREAPLYATLTKSIALAQAGSAITEYVPTPLAHSSLYALNEVSKESAFVKSMNYMRGRHGFEYSESPVKRALVIGGFLPVNVTKKGKTPRTRWLNVRTGRYSDKFPPYGQSKALSFFPQEASSEKIYAYMSDSAAGKLTALYYDIAGRTWTLDESGVIIGAYYDSQMQNCFIAGGNMYGGAKLLRAGQRSGAGQPYMYRLFERRLDGSGGRNWEFMAMEEAGMVWLAFREAGLPEISAANFALEAAALPATGDIPPAANPRGIEFLRVLRPSHEGAPMLLNAVVVLPRSQWSADNRYRAVLEFEPESGTLKELDILGAIEWGPDDKPEDMVFGGVRNPAGGGLQYDPVRGISYLFINVRDAKTLRSAGSFLVRFSMDGAGKIIERYSKDAFTDNYPHLMPDGALYYIRHKSGTQKQEKGLRLAYIYELVKYSPDTDSTAVIFEALDLNSFYPAVE